MGKLKKITLQDYFIHKKVKRHNETNKCDRIFLNTDKLEKHYKELNDKVYEVKPMTNTMKFVLTNSIERHNVDIIIPFNVMVKSGKGDTVLVNQNMLYIDLMSTVLDLWSFIDYFTTLGISNDGKKYYNIIFNADKIISHIVETNHEEIITIFGPKVLDDIISYLPNHN